MKHYTHTLFIPCLLLFLSKHIEFFSSFTFFFRSLLCLQL